VRKNNVQMTQVAAKLNDREIRAVSDYVAGLR
jgi:cytochrome c553